MNTCSVKPRRKQNRLNSILKHHKGRIALCILLAVTGSLMSAGIRTAVGDAVDRFRQGEAAFGIFYGAVPAERRRAGALPPDAVRRRLHRSGRVHRAAHPEPRHE